MQFKSSEEYEWLKTVKKEKAEILADVCPYKGQRGFKKNYCRSCNPYMKITGLENRIYHVYCHKGRIKIYKTDHRSTFDILAFLSVFISAIWAILLAKYNSDSIFFALPVFLVTFLVYKWLEYKKVFISLPF